MRGVAMLLDRTAIWWHTAVMTIQVVMVLDAMLTDAYASEWGRVMRVSVGGVRFGFDA